MTIYFLSRKTIKNKTKPLVRKVIFTSEPRGSKQSKKRNPAVDHTVANGLKTTKIRWSKNLRDHYINPFEPAAAKKNLKRLRGPAKKKRKNVLDSNGLGNVMGGDLLTHSSFNTSPFNLHSLPIPSLCSMSKTVFLIYVCALIIFIVVKPLSACFPTHTPEFPGMSHTSSDYPSFRL